MHFTALNTLQVPLRGCVDVGGGDFPEQFSEFSFRTLLTKPEVNVALSKIKVWCAMRSRLNDCIYPSRMHTNGLFLS